MNERKSSTPVIEELFRDFIKNECDGVWTKQEIQSMLHDDDTAKLLWDDFSKWHRDEFVGLVREQVAAFLKKRKVNVDKD